MLISYNTTLSLEKIVQTMMKKYNAHENEPTTLSTFFTFFLITLKNVTFHTMARNFDQKKDQMVELMSTMWNDKMY